MPSRPTLPFDHGCVGRPTRCSGSSRGSRAARRRPGIRANGRRRGSRPGRRRSRRAPTSPDRPSPSSGTCWSSRRHDVRILRPRAVPHPGVADLERQALGIRPEGHDDRVLRPLRSGGRRPHAAPPRRPSRSGHPNRSASRRRRCSLSARRTVVCCVIPALLQSSRSSRPGDAQASRGLHTRIYGPRG